MELSADRSKRVWGVGGMAGHAGPPVGPASDVVLARRAPDGDIQAQAPHEALLPSRRLKSTRPIAVGPPATAAALAPADCLSDGL